GVERRITQRGGSMSDNPASPVPADLGAESRQIWDTNAEAWDTKVAGGGGFQSVLIAPTIEAMVDIRPGERVLDIACGHGTVARLLKPGGRFVFSVMHPCFNGQAIAMQAELPDYADAPIYSMKVAQYLSAQTTKGLAINEQPVQQYYWHRPLHLLLNPAFEAG